MGVACSSTWFLIVTLLAWGFVAFVAALGAAHASVHDEEGEAPVRALRKAPRRFVVARVPRSAGVHPYALAPEPDAARITPSM